MLHTQERSPSGHMFASSDSSWNDDVDHGQSTGCFLLFYMGGIVDNSSNMPDPVALPSAEAEYNEACLACMATNHLCMRLKDLEGKQISSPKELYLDNQSAIAIGKSFKDTKNTRHILEDTTTSEKASILDVSPPSTSEHNIKLQILILERNLWLHCLFQSVAILHDRNSGNNNQTFRSRGVITF
jgi:hypothetical protein